MTVNDKINDFLNAYTDFSIPEKYKKDVVDEALNNSYKQLNEIDELIRNSSIYQEFKSDFNTMMKKYFPYHDLSDDEYIESTNIYIAFRIQYKKVAIHIRNIFTKFNQEEWIKSKQYDEDIAYLIDLNDKNIK